MLICIKQHLSNIWSSIHEKVQQHWVEKSVIYKLKREEHKKFIKTQSVK